MEASCSTSCLYVHCKSGNKSGPMTIYALLRIRFNVSESDAWNVLQSRKRLDRQPCANLMYGQDDCLQFIQRVLADTG